MKQELIHAIRANAYGISIDELASQFAQQVSRRTILRRLDELVEDGTIIRQGKARATRYLLAPTQPAPLALREKPEEDGMLREDSPEALPPRPVDLSSSSQELRSIVRTPHPFRTPVGYKREFLDRYMPNDTFYLPASLRTQLHALGQSQQMAELPPGTYARQVLNRLIIDLSWNSSRLEGSTYSLLETDHLLALGRSEEPDRVMEAQMILNHKAGIEFLVESPDDLRFNRYTLLNLHAILTEGLLRNVRAEGSLRTIPVGIGGTVYHPTSQPALIEECFDNILAKASAIQDPLECCFFLMVHMPYLQPFEDGNKRSSRLAANIPLIRSNMSPLSFVGVPVRDYTDGIIAVYELNRVELLRDVFAYAYERSAERYAGIRDDIGDPEPIAMRYRAEIKDCVRDVVVRKLTKPEAAQQLRRWAALHITASDREKFIEVVEERLLALTEGSIARVRLRPSEFEAWWPIWTGR